MELITASVKVEHAWPQNLVDADKVDFESEKSYYTENSFLQAVTNAWITSDSVIYKNGILLKGSLPDELHLGYYKFRYLVKSILAFKKKLLSHGIKYLIATDSWSVGHFHWFCDVLPKLYSVRNICSAMVLLLPDHPYIRSFGIQSLDKLDLKFQDIIWMKPDHVYHLPTVHFITKIASSGHMHPVMMSAVSERITRGYQSGERRIYISRERASVRKILNEKEFSTMLQSNGFEVVFSEDLSLDDEIALFSQTKSLVSLHGGGLTNCIFMRSACNLIEIRKREGASTNVGFWHLADSVGQKYFYFNGIPDSNLPLVGKGCNLTVDIKEFEKTVLEKI